MIEVTREYLVRALSNKKPDTDRVLNENHNKDINRNPDSELDKISKEKINIKNLVDLRNIKIDSIDISDLDFSYVDLSWSEIRNTSCKNTDFSHSKLENTLCRNVDFYRANLEGSSLSACDFRTCSLKEANCIGSDFKNSILLDTNLEGIIYDKSTKNFSLRCPEEGYFIGYKKCFNDLLVTLLIPTDAKRSSGTNSACRCDKAKVIAISKLDGSGFYREAVSLVDETFIYRLGQFSYADSFDDNRWLDSSHGIHFWMTKEEAIAY
ncbi:pentapeptide repeat-containing protein [Peptostreptococcus equinus]|uniref:Pentapeptide repeat-containing protein n=1 Tax=Peptostreptococcus equinus TaxID=3003601 RepID=A0ABY7JTJ4_9FIRM|nr:pentapeptide repeat-containing protein [Peptostreptococcus sp. CBA3647]WAW15037.1 pentapeptide repeat-containing protein [Peptostreptococcus sp. CBA3647]